MHPVVDPDLYPNLAHLGLGLLEAVIYVRIERVQRNPSLGDGLLSAHLDAAQPASAPDPGSLGAASHGARERPLHGPPESRPAFELLGYGLGHQSGVELGPRDLAHVDLDLLARDPLEIVPQRIDLAATLADDDARARGVNVYRDLTLLGSLADLDVRYTGPAQLLLDVVPDLQVLAKKLGKVPIRVPAALEVDLLALAPDAEAEALRVYLLTIYSSSSSGVPTATPTGAPSSTVIWLVRLRIMVARPMARAL